jgi:hypothetical protein
MKEIEQFSDPRNPIENHRPPVLPNGEKWNTANRGGIPQGHVLPDCSGCNRNAGIIPFIAQGMFPNLS